MPVAVAAAKEYVARALTGARSWELGAGRGPLDHFGWSRLTTREAVMQARRKVYVEGSRPDVRVPFAEVELTGDNPPVRLYDTSGPGSDPEVGLPPLRGPWIAERGDVAPSGAPARRWPGRTGSRPTQLAYARAGVVTPEMEFVAIREGVAAGVGPGRDRRRPGGAARQRQPPRDASR